MDCNKNEQEKVQKWIVDTDPGIDDMLAILYLLGRKNNEILLISTVDGNVSLDKVTVNARKILKIVNKKNQISQGAKNPILKFFSNETGYHFEDGFGNCKELQDVKYDDVEISQSSGILKMIELVKKYPKEINFLCLAPTTNLAAAFMIYPEIVNNINLIYVMGGTFKSLGNHLPVSEFNLAYDFIAAKIFYQNFKNIIITPWEPTTELHYNCKILNKIKFDLINNNVKYNEQVFHYVEKLLQIYDEKMNGTEYCDFYSIIPAFNPNCVKKFVIADIDISLDSVETLGKMIIKNRRQVKNMSFEDFMKTDFFENNQTNKKIYFEEMDENEVLKEFTSVFTGLV